MASGDVTSYADVAVRAAATVLTADSATFTTTEVVLASCTFTQTSGQTYKINVQAALSSSVLGTEICFGHVREATTVTDVTSNVLQSLLCWIPTASTNGYPLSMYVEYTAPSTGSKIIVFTGLRSAGTGNHQLRAGSNHPFYMTIDRIVQ